MSEPSPSPTITPWPFEQPPSDEALNSLLRAEGLTPRWWAGGPSEQYGIHSHPYNKVLYCARGAIRFDLADRSFELSPGDRLDVPAGVVHSAVAGPPGVSCVEAARV